MATYTNNYHLPLYEDNDKPNLRDQYNNAMNTIDSQFTENAADYSTLSSLVSGHTQDISDIEEEVNGKAPINHASTTTNYGVATTTQYGHVMLSDTVSSGSTGVPTSDALIEFVTSSMSHQFAGKDIVTVGDSIMLGTGTTNASVYGMHAVIGSLLGGTVYNYAENNAGFTVNGTGSLGTNIAGQLTAAASSHSDASLVIISGGINDSFSTPDVYSSALSTFNNAKSLFPDALIVCAPGQCGNIALPEYNSENFISVIQDIEEAALNTGILLVPDCWMMCIGRSDLVNSDNVHPNNNGAALEAAKIVAGIMGWNYKPTYSGTITSSTCNIDNGNSFVTCVDGIVSFVIVASAKQQLNFNDVIVTLPAWCQRKVNAMVATAVGSDTSFSTGGAFLANGDNSLHAMTPVSPGQFIYASATYPLGA